MSTEQSSSISTTGKLASFLTTRIPTKGIPGEMIRVTDSASPLWLCNDNGVFIPLGDPGSTLHAIVTTANLPAASSALNGTIMIEDTGVGINLVVYALDLRIRVAIS